VNDALSSLSGLRCAVTARIERGRDELQRARTGDRGERRVRALTSTSIAHQQPSPSTKPLSAGKGARWRPWFARPPHTMTLTPALSNGRRRQPADQRVSGCWTGCPGPGDDVPGDAPVSARTHARVDVFGGHECGAYCLRPVRAEIAKANEIEEGRPHMTACCGLNTASTRLVATSSRRLRPL